MWTCAECGERHQDQFKECWKCVGKEMAHAMTDAPPAALPLPAQPPERRLRSTASILFRVAVAFLVAMLLGTAIYHRYGFSLSEGIAAGAMAGSVVGFLVGMFFWVAFPYDPDEPTRAEADAAELSRQASRPEKSRDF